MSRVSFYSQFENPLRILMKNTSELDKTMRKISSGKEISRPSDDPPSVVRLFRFHNESASIKQNQKNIVSARNFLDNSEGVMGQVTDLLQRTRELGVRAANDSLSSGERNLIASEVDERLEELVDISNARMGGRFLFGGAETEGLDEVFSVERNGRGEIIGVTYNGDANQLRNQVGDGENVVSNLLGHEIFQASNQSVVGGMEIDDPDEVLSDIADIPATSGYFQLGGERYHYNSKEESLQDIVDKINSRGAPIGAEIVENDAGNFQLQFSSRTPQQIFMRDFDRDPEDENGVKGLLHDLQFVGDNGGEPPTASDDNFPISYHENAAVTGKSIFDSMIDFRHALQAGEIGDELEDPVYGSAQIDATRTIQSIRDDIPTAIQQSLEDMQLAIDNNLVHRSIGGARTNRINSAEVRSEDQHLHTTELISQLEDADLAEIITTHRRQEAVQQASLRMASNVMTMSLANFI